MFTRRGGPPADVQELPVARRRGVAPNQVPTDRLRLTVMRRIDGLLAGDHAGLFPGHGTERGEARPYVPGDDPRHIDWAVTARTGDPHVRDTIADHELELWLVVDTSSSLAFGTGRATKHDLAWSSAGAFALLASDGGNRVGFVGTTPRPATDRPKIIPARSGSQHIGAVLAELRRPPEDGEVGDLAGSLRLLQRAAKRRGMVVVVSDFIGGDEWAQPMRWIAHRHEVIAVEVVDPREIELPDVGLISVVDPESGRRRLIDTSKASVRDRYADLAARRRGELAKRLASCGVDQLTLRTDRDWVLDFVQFVATRRTRLIAAGGQRR